MQYEFTINKAYLKMIVYFYLIIYFLSKVDKFLRYVKIRITAKSRFEVIFRNPAFCSEHDNFKAKQRECPVKFEKS